MSYTAWPIAQDVTDLLARQEEPITLPASFDVQAELDATITSWNERTHYRPFAQTSSTPSARTFDPPGPDRKGYSRGGSKILLLDNGLVSLSSLTIGVNSASGQTGTALVQGIDFWVGPANASADSKPYTEIQFAYVRRGLPQSIVISGVWGYCLASSGIPADAWKAVRDLAAARCLETLSAWIAQGPSTMKEEDISESYDSGVIEDILRFLSIRGERVLGRYRLMH